MLKMLKFDLEDASFKNQVNNSLFRQVKLKAFASGVNAHTLPVDEEVLRKSAKSIYDKPLIWKYRDYFDDADGHEDDQVPCGFVKDSEDNPIIFERQDDGRLFIVVNALIWTRYCGRLIEIFERDDFVKDVSVEIAVDVVDENAENKEIKEFVIAGITILGGHKNPACKGAKAEMFKFSLEELFNDKKEYANNYIYIDNSFDNSVSGNWRNPRRKLLVPLLNANNSNQLLNETYLSFTDDLEVNSLNYKHPHHIICEDKLVVHKDGLRVAFEKLNKNSDSKYINHILKHYKEMGLSENNYEKFGLNLNHFNKFIDFNKESEVVFVDKSNIETNEVEKEEVMSTEKVDEMADETKLEEAKMDETKLEEAKMDEDDSDSDDIDDKDDSDDDEDKSKTEDVSKSEMSFTEEDYKSMSEKMTKLENENKAYMSQIEAMSDYKELKKFKEETLEKQENEVKMRKMSEVFDKIELTGIKFSEENKEKFISEFSKFSDIELWGNYVKSLAFDTLSNDDVIGYSKPDKAQKITKSNSIWDNFI